MTVLPGFIKQIDQPVYKYKYSVCTLVTRKEQYAEMLNSFINGGFTEDICEYLIIDNSEINKMDAYQGLNALLQQATGEFVILCHQDIELMGADSRRLLEDQIIAITKLDPTWGVLGNAGGADRLYKRMAIKIAYPDGFIDVQGNVPQKVGSLDENFMLVKNSANLAFSGDIGGYHLYGFNLCTVARLLGYSAYVIDFLLVHKSTGNADVSYYEILKQVKTKYTSFMKGRYVNTTIARFYLSGSAFWNMMFNTRVFRRVIKTAEEIKFKLSKP